MDTSGWGESGENGGEVGGREKAGEVEENDSERVGVEQLESSSSKTIRAALWRRLM